MRARFLDKGVIPCFERGLTDADGEPVNAEVSAAAWNGSRLVMASDKNVPGAHRSPVFAVECDDQCRPRADTIVHYTADLIQTAEKYEDFAPTAVGDHMIASTGFDRADSESAEQHVYNRLLIWPVNDPDAARLIAEEEHDGVKSSVSLRREFAGALDAPYFKVEGLAAIPGTQGADDVLLFGIREVGQDHENFEYVARVIAAPYRVEDDALRFTGGFEMVYEFDPGRWADVRFDVGLSSLEYDRYNDRLLFLTSFEVEDDAGEDVLGAYLWALSLDDFRAGRDPVLVAGENGGALEFVNKAEGIAVLDAVHAIVVYDNDRALDLEHEHPRSAREPHEAPYALIAIEA